MKLTQAAKSMDKNRVEKIKTGSVKVDARSHLCIVT